MIAHIHHIPHTSSPITCCETELVKNADKTLLMDVAGWSTTATWCGRKAVAAFGGSEAWFAHHSGSAKASHSVWLTHCQTGADEGERSPRVQQAGAGLTPGSQAPKPAWSILTWLQLSQCGQSCHGFSQASMVKPVMALAESIWSNLLWL